MYVVYISGGVTMTCLDMSFTPGGLKFELTLVFSFSM